MNLLNKNMNLLNKIVRSKRIAYCFSGASIVSFITGITLWNIPNEWGGNKVAMFMSEAMVGYIVVASLCFAAYLIAANASKYSQAVIFALIPTTIALCFLLFGLIVDNNVVSWWLMLLSSLCLYPILIIDYKIKH